MEERTLGVENNTEEIDSSVKVNITSNKILIQNTQVIWDSTKRPILRIIWIEIEEFKLKGTENIFKKS